MRSPFEFYTAEVPQCNRSSSPFLGGSQNDYGYAIALDSLKNVYIAGKTGSDDFPVAGTPVRTKCGEIFVAGVPTGTCGPDGAFDAFVTKLNAAGMDLFIRDSSAEQGGIGRLASR